MEYQAHRYLEHASLEQLVQRVRDIVCNLTSLNNEGKFSFRPPDAGGAEWMELFAHVQEEHRLRGIDFAPNMMQGTQLPRPTYPARPKSVEAIKGTPLKPEPFLVKYGNQKYLKDGSIRISAASSWLKSDNPAIHDDELKKSFFAHPSDVAVTVHQSENLPVGHRVEPTGNVTFTQNATEDYYALCLSRVYDHRLFDDFEADCCLIVYDPILFGRRLEAAIRERVADWSMFSCPMDYYDPFNVKRGDVNVHWSKDFKFWYQREFRFAWVGSGVAAELAPLDVSVAPITDFGELICLV